MLDFLHVIEGRKNDEGFAHPSAQSGICVRPLRWQWERPARFHVVPREQQCEPPYSTRSGLFRRRRPDDVDVNGVRRHTSAGDQGDIGEVSAH